MKLTILLMAAFIGSIMASEEEMPHPVPTEDEVIEYYSAMGAFYGCVHAEMRHGRTDKQASDLCENVWEEIQGSVKKKN